MAYKQHFIEWFSGKQLPSYWDFTQIVATATGAMYDGVDGGYRITTSATTGARGEIDFGDKRQFDLASSECILSIRYDDTNYSRVMAGLSAGGGIVEDQTTTNHYTFGLQSNENLSYLYTKDSSGSSFTSSGVDPLTNWQTAKMASNGSDVKLYLFESGSWSLKVTKTTNKPTGNGQPYFGQWAPTAAVSWGEINYMECYNT